MSRFLKHLNIDIIIFIILMGLIFVTFKFWSFDEVSDTRETVNQLSEKPESKIVKPSTASKVRKIEEPEILPEDNERESSQQVDSGNMEENSSVLPVEPAGKSRQRRTTDSIVANKRPANSTKPPPPENEKAAKRELPAENKQVDSGIRKENFREQGPKVITHNNRTEPIKTRTNSAEKGNTIVISISGKKRLLATEDSY